MGNIQTGDTKSGKSKALKIIRGKRGKIEDDHFTGIVPDEYLQITSHLDQIIAITPKTTATLATSELTSPQSNDSSFFDAQTTIGFTTEINQCYSSEDSVLLNHEEDNQKQENFVHDLALNSFKLNEHRVRRETVLNQKLSKLGVSKTSTISLESDPNECYVSENVEVITGKDLRIIGKTGCLQGEDNVDEGDVSKYFEDSIGATVGEILEDDTCTGRYF